VVAQNSGTIHEVFQRLQLWCSRSERGFARAEYDSELARIQVDNNLQKSFTLQGIPFNKILLRQEKIPGEVISDLIEKLNTLEPGVISISGFSVAFPEGELRKDALRILNYNRENLAKPQQRQIWWIGNSFIDEFVQLVPDLNSWFLVRIYLSEFILLPEEDLSEIHSQSFPFTPPTYGFIGRDQDILEIEKSLLRHNLLLVKGMGGTGKTTLLKYLGMWWQKIRFVEKVFYFGYDEQTYTLESILATVAKTLLNRVANARWQAMNLADRQQRIIDLLNSHSHCLFLDNLESISGRELAIAHTLPIAEREKLKKFLAALSGGKTKVVLGSRSQEEWLQQGTFGDNIHEMRGLDPEARTQLAEKILLSVVTTKRAEKILKEPAFARLMKLLAGYPLAMEVVLRNLKNQTPEQILTSLQAADVNLDTGSGGKTESILKCVEYSHSNIAPELQEVLISLAPFTSFIDRQFIPLYVAKLQEQEALQSFDLSNLDDALQEAIQWGLLSPISTETENLLTIQPVFPYFLKTKLDATDSPTRLAIERAFREHYRALAEAYEKLMSSKEPQQRQMGIAYCRWEYENLYCALEMCLEEKEDFSIFFCLDQYLRLIQDKSAGLKLAQQVWDALKQYPDSAKKAIEQQIISACDFLAAALLAEKLYPNAIKQYEQEQQLIDAAMSLDEQSKKTQLAITFHQLGRVSQELREYEQARQYYQQALDINIQFNNVYEQASTFHNLGIVSQALREFERAQQYYQQALDINIQFNDVYEQASTFHQLGSVSQELREYEQARQYYQQALDIYIQFNAFYYQASTFHQLGRVAEEEQQFEEAISQFLAGLRIFAEYKDGHNLQIVIRSLVRVYQQHPDEQILVQTAQILGVEVEQIRGLFEQGGEASE
jgi:tetratricopeptide (TPR) repeat protein